MYIPYKLRLLKWHLFRRREGERILSQAYRELHGKDLEVENPERFSEKLFSRMVLVNRHGSPVFTRLADKYLAREYVKNKVGEKYLVELLWHGSDPSGIPFDDLPGKCVAKTNHGSGGNIVVSGTVNRDEVVGKLKRWLNENYYWGSREYHYFKIPRLALIERFLDDGAQDGPLDYRFWCFNGRPELVQVDNHTHSINQFYDVEWRKVSIHTRQSFLDLELETAEPINLKEMLLVAAELSSGFGFVRVDLYNINGAIYFGELTFTPGAGRFKFTPDNWDVVLGKKWGWGYEADYIALD